jgi:hypothetical protein
LDLHFICGQVGGMGLVISQVQVLVFRVLPLAQKGREQFSSGSGSSERSCGKDRREQEQVLSVEL